MSPSGFAESFHSRLRDELLNAELFADVREARALAATWRNEYNRRRPHSSLGYVPPAVYAATLNTVQPEVPPTPLASPAPRAAPLPPARPAAYFMTPILNHRLS